MDPVNDFKLIKKYCVRAGRNVAVKVQPDGTQKCLDGCGADPCEVTQIQKNSAIRLSDAT